jgi:hypothetical protein
MITGYYIQPMTVLPGRFNLVETDEHYQPTIIIDCLTYDRAISLYWRHMRRFLREREKRKREPDPTLFPLVDDARPTTQRKAADRYQQPMLFD